MEPITWAVIVGVSLLGGAVAYFWDEIEAWANHVIEYIINTINPAIEVISNATVSLFKKGKLYLKIIEVNIVNNSNNKVRLESAKEEIPESELPQEIKDKLRSTAKLKLMQSQT